jgi:predicted O-linked N-acetylglucosamine transferase (SPINDLY family)
VADMDKHNEMKELACSKFRAREYEQSIQLYSDLADNCELDAASYFYLGASLALEGKADEAQFIWMDALLGAGENEERCLENLINFLTVESDRLLKEGHLEDVKILLFHRHSINPTNVIHLLDFLSIAIKFSDWDVDCGLIESTTDLLNESELGVLPSKTALYYLNDILKGNPFQPNIGQFIKALIRHTSDKSTLMSTLMPIMSNLAYAERCSAIAVKIAEAYLEVDPENVEILAHLATFYQNSESYDKGIETARKRFSLVELKVEKIFSSHLIVRGLLSAGGRWAESIKAIEIHRDLLNQLSWSDVAGLNSVYTLRLFIAAYFLPYFQDSVENRILQNKVVGLVVNNIHNYSKDLTSSLTISSSLRSLKNTRKLRIGYLSHCMSQHSVGWLARWLFQHHDEKNFELYGYSVHYRPGDSLQEWYIERFKEHRFLGQDFNFNTQAFARQISEDEIDILVDLDSITLDVTCEILAFKPAPIQVTWLGWDAIGMSTIDYFIADPYVLPDHAQDYYTEKIWRLPETYLAVDGFEVAVPTLRRSDLKLPENAVTFLTAQRGYKRHRDTAILQIKIIAGVPDAYLLIKGFADDQSIQNFFYEIADEVGVSRDRLRFLEVDPSEEVHRANLRIADVVLDTYPYNGATTTMETLWMEVPIVTRVGEQFAARNSYTMMMNAGITEGIAWNAAEYVEWGIKLGTDAKLRQEVSWKLRESKKTAPLWDGKKFARQMEDAYQQMWKIHVESNS